MNSMGETHGTWVPHELSEDNNNRRRDTAYTLLSKFRRKMFCTKSLQAMKSGFFTKGRNSWSDPGQPSTSKPDIDAKKVLYL